MLHKRNLEFSSEFNITRNVCHIWIATPLNENIKLHYSEGKQNCHDLSNFELFLPDQMMHDIMINSKITYIHGLLFWIPPHFGIILNLIQSNKTTL